MAIQDLILNAADDVAIRQQLILVALGKEPADLAIRVGRLLHVYTRLWADDQEIIIKGRRIAWVGPAGEYRGEVARRVHYPDLLAVPGFGEVHKHIESTHLTPEYEAALVLPRGNTWTCEASHEFGNVNGARNIEFWQAARKLGVPHKVFIQPGSAVPPSAWEETGGWYGYDDQKAFMADNLSVVGLDEVMDWPAVWNPENPAYDRVWGMMRATIEQRGVVEGHGSGLTEPHDSSAFAASGLASDHELWCLDDAWEKLIRGVFIEIRPFNFPEIIPGLLERGLTDWSNVAFTTDDRSVSETLEKGASDYNVRAAIGYGLAPEIAVQCMTIHPARHMRIDNWVGSITPGRYADLVLLDDLNSVSIACVYADGEKVSEGKTYLGSLPKIEWPNWATKTVNIGRELVGDDFVIKAEPGRATMQAALLRPFHWNQEFLVAELPVAGGAVQRDPARKITKFAIVDRYKGDGKLAAMFWIGCGPGDPDSALACSMAHDAHNIWVTGSSDAAMAMAVNRLQQIGGGWALVHRGRLAGDVRYEAGGLMTARPAEELDAEMQAFYRAAEPMEWMYEPSVTTVWKPGFPESLIFATLTCAPWRWVLVAPNARVPNGFVNVQTGELHAVVW
jgi:adenine deaminase